MQWSLPAMQAGPAHLRSLCSWTTMSHLRFTVAWREFAGGPAMSDAERTTFLADIADADNATASFIPNGAAAIC